MELEDNIGKAREINKEAIDKIMAEYQQRRTKKPVKLAVDDYGNPRDDLFLCNVCENPISIHEFIDQGEVDRFFDGKGCPRCFDLTGPAYEYYRKIMFGQQGDIEE